MIIIFGKKDDDNLCSFLFRKVKNYLDNMQLNYIYYKILKKYFFKKRRWNL